MTAFVRLWPNRVPHYSIISALEFAERVATPKHLEAIRSLLAFARAETPLEQGEHNLSVRVDWEGDPEVINGTRSWETTYCSECGAEGDELKRPCPEAPCPTCGEPPNRQLEEDLNAARRNLAAASARNAYFEELEATLCPEDYGFSEYIGVLKKRLVERDNEIAELRARIAPSAIARRCSKCGGCEARNLPASCDCAEPAFVAISARESTSRGQLEHCAKCDRFVTPIAPDDERLAG